jgi:hypothetical protein
VVEKFSTDKLAVYVVWLPVLNLQDPATLQRNAHRYAAKEIPQGPHVMHFTDPEVFLGKAYSPILKVPYGNPAWDVYFAFGADIRWGDSVPTPTHFEWNTGGGSEAKLLDGPTFAGEVQKLLAKAGK